MEKVIISPATLGGEVKIPPSKSAAHRILICSALAKGVSKVYPACHSADIDATIKAVEALGAKVEEKENCFYITGITESATPKGEVIIDCKESGSTLRFLIPIVAALGVNATFIGCGRLPERPIDPLVDILEKNGVKCSSNHLPLTIEGKLTPGVYNISGDVSSQYLTGLLLAAPLICGDVKINLTTTLNSAGYVAMTIDTMKDFGVTVDSLDGLYECSGTYTTKTAEIEGDWSQACFFMAMAAAGADIKIYGLKENSLQGDKKALELFENFGAKVSFENGVLSVSGGNLKGCKIDCSQIPDMVPALAITAAFAKGETQLFGAERLRVKESDRIKATVQGLLNMGVSARELPDGLVIYGSEIKGGAVDGQNDHRIVMAFSVLAAFGKEKSEISYPFAINKSYPTFFKDYKMLGGKANVINTR